MQSTAKRGKFDADLDDKLINAMKEFDIVEVEDVLKRGGDPNLPSKPDKTAFDYLLDDRDNLEVGEYDHITDFHQTDKYYKMFLGLQILEMLLKNGLKYDETKSHRLPDVWFYIILKHGKDIDVETLFAHSLLDSAGEIILLNIVKLAEKKGLDLLKRIHIVSDFSEDEDMSVYLYLKVQKESLNVTTFDDILSRLRTREVTSALSGTFSEPMREGEMLQDVVPPEIAEHIAKYTKGGKKKRKTTKRKIIKRKTRKSIFKRKSVHKNRTRKRK